MVRSRVPRKILGVIPARFASSRFPGKASPPSPPKPCCSTSTSVPRMARYLTSIIIATDDERDLSTPPKLRRPRAYDPRRPPLRHRPRGRSRLRRKLPNIVVNIQGDEPLIDPDAIDAAILPLVDEPAIPMGTLKKRIEDPREITDPNVVKVVTDRAGDAIYFSRCPIPYYARRARRGVRSISNTSVCTSTGAIFCCAIRSARGPARTGRAPGAVARARKRLPDPRGGNRIRIAGRRYAGGSGAGRAACSSSVGSLTGVGDNMAKYIFVTGGVVSSLGKGIAAASIGCLLESRGLTRHAARSSIPT